MYTDFILELEFDLTPWPLEWNQANTHTAPVHPFHYINDPDSQ